MLASLQMFGFMALWSPFFFLLLLLIGAFYALLVGPWRRKWATEHPPSRKQKTYFYTGLVLLYVIKGSPIDLLGHLMFSVHMTQMAILYLIVPQCFILGIPNGMYEKLFRVDAIKRVYAFLTKPLIALLLFNGLFSFYHVPFIFDVIKTNMIYHATVTTILFIAAWCMWWPVINKLPEWQTLSGIKKVGYIFANGVLLTPACALIIFADTPLYRTFSDPSAWLNALQLCVPSGTLASLHLTGPQMFLSMSLLNDQQLGGVLMKIIQEIVYGTMLFFIFIDWYQKEREKEPQETVVSPHPSESS
ncbi:putative membrane protein [Anoxybacillus voinovskiensis]|uniref:Putative membrane protein n=1 Tax=Anoxybacteroides voinovskiense TaxID=230470 RepID=A0A840DR37_9BACL|nr:cytochrome c oxidase assembly factor CtaG [Anoxybacillus voinovskiensis]MBB4072518.1 putative membrane protein [Anoxybacillus voinovskiensis]GGJ54852.1 cytochrome c oxidase assembly factor CtaG [Anoxybacillus voinovskiensis]